jgi:hypothetical protein
MDTDSNLSFSMSFERGCDYDEETDIATYEWGCDEEVTVHVHSRRRACPQFGRCELNHIESTTRSSAVN